MDEPQITDYNVNNCQMVGHCTVYHFLTVTVEQSVIKFLHRRDYTRKKILPIFSILLATMIWYQLPRQSRAKKDWDLTTMDPNVTLGWGPKEVYPFSIDYALKQCKIVPMIIDKSPKHLLEVLYEDETIVDLGVYLRPEDMLFEPKMITWPDGGEYYYTLIIADADFPARVDYSDSQCLLFMVVNAHNGTWREEDVIVPYIGPEPDLDSGLHRVLHVLYRQPKKLQFDEPRLDENRNNSRRQNFVVRKFTKKYNLGQPHAINFFFVENWDFVDTEPSDLALSGLQAMENSMDLFDEIQMRLENGEEFEDDEEEFK
nr:PREDICTED: putative odorant-binding protein A5 isoform X1 [Bemisia tabaci]